MPAMNAGKKGSPEMMSVSRAMTSPSANERLVLSDRARRLGCQPSSAATLRMRTRVSGATPGRSLRAKETSPLLTPASRATSAMVGRASGMALLVESDRPTF